MSNFDTMDMSDHGMWMAQRHGKFTSSEIVRLMTGADEPELLTGDRLTLAIEGIEKLNESDFSGKTGLPLIKPLRAVLGWEVEITTDESKYAFKMRNGPELSDGAKTYAKEVAVEMLTQFQETPELKVPHILWGKEHEVNAISRLAFERDLEITNVGKEQVFVSCDADSGSTPDGVIVDKNGNKTLETKCPDSKTHAEYIVNISNAETLKETEPKYYWQMQDQMRHTEAVSGLFVSYDPRFEDEDQQLHVVFIARNNKDIALIEKQLALAVKFRDEYIQKIKDATS